MLSVQFLLFHVVLYIIYKLYKYWLIISRLSVLFARFDELRDAGDVLPTALLTHDGEFNSLSYQSLFRINDPHSGIACMYNLVKCL